MDIQTVLTAHGGSHFSVAKDTRSHEFPWVKILIPLEGARWKYRDAREARSSAHAMVVSAHVHHEIGCIGSTMTLFVPGHRLSTPSTDGTDSSVRVLAPKYGNSLARLVQNLYSSDTELAIEEAIKIVSDRPPRILDSRVCEVMTKLNDGPRWNAERLAAEVGLSKSRLSRLFRAEVGTTMQSYALFRRLVHAMKISSEHRTLAGVAQESGFSDQAHLARTARRFIGKPASHGGRIVQVSSR